MAETIDSFSYGKKKILMQNLFIVPTMQHSSRAEPLYIVQFYVW